MSKLIDLTNQKFGEWTVLYYAGNSKWHCRCSCGNERDVNTVSLRKGTSKSCGCQKIIKSRENNGKFINEIGNRYGFLTVIEKDEELSIKKHRAYWICQCDCGNLKTVSSKCLREGKTQSCGCNSISRGETKINQILIENNINFQREYRVNINKRYYRFDFAIFDNNQKLITFIEYDGKQHFDDSQLHWTDSYQNIYSRDEIKNNYCKEHNIPLIRIPYWELNDINKKYLLNKIQEATAPDIEEAQEIIEEE